MKRLNSGRGFILIFMMQSLCVCASLFDNPYDVNEMAIAPVLVLARKAYSSAEPYHDKRQIDRERSNTIPGRLSKKQKVKRSVRLRRAKTLDNMAACFSEDEDDDGDSLREFFEQERAKQWCDEWVLRYARIREEQILFYVRKFAEDPASIPRALFRNSLQTLALQHIDAIKKNR